MIEVMSALCRTSVFHIDCVGTPGIGVCRLCLLRNIEFQKCSWPCRIILISLWIAFVFAWSISRFLRPFKWQQRCDCSRQFSAYFAWSSRRPESQPFPAQDLATTFYRGCCMHCIYPPQYVWYRYCRRQKSGGCWHRGGEFSAANKQNSADRRFRVQY